MSAEDADFGELSAFLTGSGFFSGSVCFGAKATEATTSVTLGSASSVAVSARSSAFPVTDCSLSRNSSEPLAIPPSLEAAPAASRPNSFFPEPLADSSAGALAPSFFSAAAGEGTAGGSCAEDAGRGAGFPAEDGFGPVGPEVDCPAGLCGRFTTGSGRPVCPGRVGRATAGSVPGRPAAPDLAGRTTVGSAPAA